MITKNNFLILFTVRVEFSPTNSFVQFRVPQYGENYASEQKHRELVVSKEITGAIHSIHDGGPRKLHIANTIKYTSLKFYTLENTWNQNFLPKTNRRMFELIISD